MKQKHVAFLESNPTTGLEALKQTSKILGCRTTFITSDLNFYTRGKCMEETPLKYAHRILEVKNTGSFKDLKPAIDALHGEQKLDAFMSFSEYHMVPSSEAAEYLGLPHISSSASKIARNKFLTRQTLRLANIPQPNFFLVKSYDQAKQKIKNMIYPIVVKPIDGTASLNVRLVSDEQELREHIEYLLSQKNYGRSTQIKPFILLEEYVEGELVSVETLSKNGKHFVLGITNRTLGGMPYFVELGESFPVKLSQQVQVEKICLQALDAIGVNFGPVHTEIILSKKGPKILEINPRLAGGLIPELIDLTTNRRILLDVVKLHLGEEAELKNNPPKIASAFFFYSNENGYLRKIKTSKTFKDPRVKKIIFSKDIGNAVSALKSNFDRMGYIISCDDTLESAESLCKKIISETKIILSNIKNGESGEVSKSPQRPESLERHVVT